MTSTDLYLLKWLKDRAVRTCDVDNILFSSLVSIQRVDGVKNGQIPAPGPGGT